MKYRIFFSFLSFLFLMFLSCSAEDKGTTNDMQNPERAINTAEKVTTSQQNTRARIVFFGNSLTAGYHLDEVNAFPALIQKRIDSLGLDYEVINAGLSGETTAGGLNRLDWVMKQPIDIFILELGPNDVLRGFDLNTTKTNLQAIINKLKTTYPAVKIIIAGMQAPPNLGQEYTRHFKDIYTDLAKSNNILLIPFLLDGVAAKPKLNLPDGIHPNIEGQKIVMQNVWAILKEVL